jgi:5-methylcytosine-specific restriction protein A
MQSQLNEASAASFCKSISARSGLAFAARMFVDSSGKWLGFRPSSLASSNGFELRLSSGGDRPFAEVQFEEFSGSLLRHISRPDEESSALWEEVHNALLQEGFKIFAEVNGEVAVDASRPSWGIWESFSVNVSHSSPLRKDAEFEEYKSKHLRALVALLDLVLCLLPLEDDVTDFDDLGANEGRKVTVLHNRYERSRPNRNACIAIHGLRCKTCAFDFEQVYGEIGFQFIEVHHILPVSLMGGEYRLSPARDLIPLCSNCHSMIHRKNPPFSPAELEGIVSSNRHSE